jgi:hypothetical protein
LELCENGLIKYYFPLDHRKDYFLTPDPNPKLVDTGKYENIYKNGVEEGKKS